MTTPRDKQALEQAEAWFASTCIDTTKPDIEQIKRHMRIALNEQWLSDQLRDENDLNVAKLAKQRLREHLQTETQVNAAAASARNETTLRYRNRVWARWAGIASVAAAACFLFIMNSLPEATTGSTELLVDAFEQYESSDLERSLEALNDDLETLEIAWDEAQTTTDAASILDVWISDIDQSLDEAENHYEWLDTVLEGTTQ